MQKKVIDIIAPPKKKISTKKKVFEQRKEDLKRSGNRVGGVGNILKKWGPVVKPHENGGDKPERRRKTIVGIFAVLALILILAFVFSFTLAKAKIEIWPETQPLSLETKLLINKGKSQPDLSAKAIPGELFEREKIISETFTASGKVIKDKKAEGKIRVFNEYSVSPQILVASTRFVSAEGKIFRTPVRVVVPGGTYQKGKLTPGEIEINVAADQPGSEYNINSSTFSVPGFAGTDKYTKIYAKSLQAFSGGYSGEVSQVTEDDIKRAEDDLTKRAKEEAENLLKNDIRSQGVASVFNFVEDAVMTEITEKSSSVQAGSEAKDFVVQAKARSKTFIFKKDYFQNIIHEFIESQIPAGMIPYQNGLKIDLFPDNINFDSGTMMVSLKISGKIYQDINYRVLKGAVQGKSLAETKALLENQSGIVKTDVKFWPIWVNSVPNDANKIDFKLNID